jgi:ubiquinone/menaquinone biosynthesis C-methylase UbiE
MNDPTVPGAQSPAAFGAAPSRKARSILHKDWDRHVRQADELSRSPGFQQLRDRIVSRAAPRPLEQVLDVGAGTGLLALGLADRCADVWAIDISPAMVEHLRWVVAGRHVTNVYPLLGSAASLPLEDSTLDLVVSNYCYHHLDEEGKRKAASEVFRVLKPGGRFVFADMMFGWNPGDGRNRQVVASKVRALAKRGPAGYARIARNGFKVLTGTGERPATPEWWRQALEGAGFSYVSIECLAHEGGLAAAIKSR